MANHLKEWREACGLTLDQLAERIQATSGHRTDKTQLSKLENGKRRLTDHWLALIAGAMGQKAGDLFEAPIPSKIELSPGSSPENDVIPKIDSPEDPKMSQDQGEALMGGQSGSEKVPQQSSTLVAMLARLDPEDVADLVEEADRRRAAQIAKKAVRNPTEGRRTS